MSEYGRNWVILKEHFQIYYKICNKTILRGARELSKDVNHLS